MPMSLFKNNKNRNKVVNPYCSLGWLLIITIFQKCAKLKPPWVHLGKQINYIIFFLLFIFLTKKWTSAVCGGVRAHPSHPPSLRACSRLHDNRASPVKSSPAHEIRPLSSKELFLFQKLNTANLSRTS